jgi:hypothetical protein
MVLVVTIGLPLFFVIRALMTLLAEMRFFGQNRPVRIFWAYGIHLSFVIIVLRSNFFGGKPDFAHFHRYAGGKNSSLDCPGLLTTMFGLVCSNQ